MSKRNAITETEDKLDLVWGATAIARYLGVNRSRVYYLVKLGLPIKRVGFRNSCGSGRTTDS
jgi:hypothetical protein